MKEHAEEGARVREQQAHYQAARARQYADRLLAEQPEAARLLSEMPSDAAGPLVDELKARLAAEDNGEDDLQETEDINPM